MSVLRLGLIGAGFIGRSHAMAIHAVNRVFPALAIKAEAFMLAEADEARLRASGASLDFAHTTTDWRKAVDESDAVIVAVPQHMHREVVERAIAQRKPVLCEKPVGLSSADAEALAAAAQAQGVVNAVGYTYLRAPLVQYARALIAGGKLGRPLHVRGRHSEDYLADGDAPHSWRLAAATAGRCGALGDLGQHIFAVLRYLCGPIDELVGLSRTVYPTRPAGRDDPTPVAVENEDFAAALVRFECGAAGLIETSRIARGRKMDLSFEIVCENGTIAYDAERMNELSLYEAGVDGARAGFRTILANPQHPDYAGFLPAPGHGLGFNDLKTIEIKAFLASIAAGKSTEPDLAVAARIGRLCEAVIDTSETGKWLKSPETKSANRH